MDITIDKEKIFKSVDMNVSIIARSMKDADGNSLYDKVRIQERDHDLLNLYLVPVIGELTGVMRDFVTGNNDGVISVELDGRNNPVFQNELQSLCVSYAEERVACEWLKLKATEYASIYADNAHSILQQIRTKVYHKDMPEMKLYGEDE